jgi:hypothetical protein
VLLATTPTQEIQATLEQTELLEILELEVVQAAEPLFSKTAMQVMLELEQTQAVLETQE